MAVVLENSSSGSSAFTAAHTVSLGFTATAGRLLVVVFGAGSSRTLSSITSGWTLVHDNSGSTAVMFGGWAYKVAAGGETDFSFTLSSGIAASYAAFEFSGLATSSPLDQAAEDETYNNSVIRYCPTGTTAALSVSDGFAISVWVPDGAPWISGSPTITNGSTVVLTGSALAPPIVVTTQTLSSASAWSETLGYASGVTDQVWGSTAVFKQAAGGPTYTLTADAGTLTLTGQAATLAHAHKLSADSGTLTLTGQAATLTYTSSGATYTLTADAGTLTLTGTGATMHRSMGSVAGTLTLTGHDATLRRGYVLTADAGTLILTGQAAGLAQSYTLIADAGTLTLTGYSADLDYSGAAYTYTLDAEAGTLTLAGHDDGLLIGGTTTTVFYLPIRAYSDGMSGTVDPTTALDNLRSLLPSQRTPLVNADSTMSSQWYRFFDYMVNQYLGGLTQPTVADIVASVEATQASVNASAEATQLIAQQAQANAESLAAVVQVTQNASIPGASQIPPVSLSYLEP